MKGIVVIYHGDCPDGVGGAFAAYKKFGDSADYIGGVRGEPVPSGLEGKEVYCIDFTYDKATMLDIESKAKRLVVLDHHIGVKDAIEAAREHVFDNDRSGAGIAWGYFHPDTSLPRLIAYIQEIDLWRFALPNAKEVGAYLSTITLDLPTYERLLPQFQNDTIFAEIVERGRAYNEYAEHLTQQVIVNAEPVEFEGYTVLALNSGRIMHSRIGNALVKKHPPFSIIWYRHHGRWHISLRGDGSVNLAELAQRHGGNGHHNAAGFTLPFDSTLPFKFLS
ncbi:MAG TPA: hypothetical protein VIY48_14615 [Candidatus Paceibacterota bacterium]